MKKYPPRAHNKENRVDRRDYPRVMLHSGISPFDQIKPVIRTRQSESRPYVPHA